MPRIAFFSSWIAALLLAAPARAQENVTAAETLFLEGRALLEQGRIEEACPKLAESQRLDPSPGTGLNLGDCLERQGRTASAWTEFRRSAAIAAKLGDPRGDEALERAEALEARLSRLTIRVDASVRRLPGLALELDGAALTSASIDTAMPVDPGEHKLRASAPKKQPWSASVVVPPNGGNVQIRVPELASALPPPPPPPPPPAKEERGDGWGALSATGFAVTGAGLVGVVTGTVLGVVALGKNDDSNLAGHCDDANRCDPEGYELRNDARAAGDAATAAIVIGGVAMAGGGVVLLYAYQPWADEHAARATVRVGATGALIEGSW